MAYLASYGALMEATFYGGAIVLTLVALTQAALAVRADGRGEVAFHIVAAAVTALGAFVQLWVGRRLASRGDGRS